jgi:hypothetical protein
LPEIDDFASLLLEESKRFLELAKESKDDDIRSNACLHATLVIGFCALEAYINSVAEDLAATVNLSTHEKAILLEKDVGLEGGEFVLKESLKIYRLQDRTLFMHKRFSAKQFDDKAPWIGNLNSAIGLRNSLTHPKAVPRIRIEEVERAVLSIIEALDALFMAVFRKSFPAASRQLHSKLSF